MLVRFDSDVGGFTMFGDVAVTLLKFMGHSGTVPGAILAQDIPRALSRLKTNLENAPEVKVPLEEEGERADQRVPLRTRAAPLIDLLTRAAQKGKDVMWR
ncbi:MAG TPA: DUF1840 domain-containing protein [Burkholderiales bacterium]|nr:DUF1840 domain-containing protein [Burkholderiales bacterium]